MNKTSVIQLGIISAYITATLCCCTDESVSDVTRADIQSDEYAYIRSKEEALLEAANAAKMLDSHYSDKSRATDKTIRDISSQSDIIIIHGKSKSRTAVTDTLMYVINYDDDLGFAIIAANRCVPPVIAVTERGKYDSSELLQNTGFQHYMASVTNYLQLVTENTSHTAINPSLDLIPAPEYRVETDTTWYADVPYRVKVQWGQKYAEGQECPNGVAGCGPVAVAMALSYYETPSFLQLTYTPEQKSVRIDWERIKRYHADASVGTSGAVTSQDYLQIAQLCRELGHRANATYATNPNGTGTNILALKRVLGSLGFTTALKTPYSRSMSSDLSDSNSILIVSGNSGAINGGHVWICDGAIAFDIVTRIYVWNRSSALEVIPKWELTETRVDSQTYNHFNWGGYGAGNGYFADLTYHFMAGAAEHDYRYDVEYLKISL